MASITDRASLEYEGVDNLSSIVTRINKTLDNQAITVEKSQNKLESLEREQEKYSNVIKESAIKIEDYANKEEVATNQIKQRNKWISQQTVNQKKNSIQLGLAKAALNNMTVEEKQNTAAVEQATKKVESLIKKEQEITDKIALHKEALRQATASQRKATAEQESASKAAERAAKKQQQVSEAMEATNEDIRLQELRLAATQAELGNYSGNISQAAAKLTGLAVDASVMTERLDRQYKAVIDSTDSIRKYADMLSNTNPKMKKFGSLMDKVADVVDSAAEKTDTLDVSVGTLYNGFNKIIPEAVKTTTAYQKLQKATSFLAEDETKLSSATQKVATTIGQTIPALRAIDQNLDIFQNTIKNSVGSLGKFKDKLTGANKELKDTDNSAEVAAAGVEELDNELEQMNETLKQMESLEVFNTLTGYVSEALGAVQEFTSAGNELSKSLLENSNITRKFNVVYGENTEAVKANYEATTKLLGVDWQTYQQSSAAIAQQAENYGLASKEAAQFGTIGTDLISVLSATNTKGLDAADVAERMTSAFRGEAEASEALNLSLGDTAMASYTEQAKEAGLAIDGSWRTLDDATKQQLRLASAIQQVADQNGIAIDPITDMASAQEAMNRVTLESVDGLDESQQAAIRWRIAVGELSEALRGSGVSAMNLMAGVLETIASIMTTLQPLFDQLIVKLGELWESFGKGVEVIGGQLQPLFAPLINAIKTIAEQVTKLFDAITSGFSAGFGGGGGGGDIISSLVDSFGRLLTVGTEIYTMITTALLPVYSLLANIVGQVTAVVVKLITAFIDWIVQSDLLKVAVMLITNAISLFATIVEIVWGVVKNFINTMVKLVEVIFALLTPGATLTIIMSALSSVFQLIKEVLGGLVGIVVTFVTTLAQSVVQSGLLNDILSLILGVFITLSPVLGMIVELFQFLVETIFTLIDSIAQAIIQMDLMGMIANVVSIAVKLIVEAVDLLVNILRILLPPLIAALSVLVPILTTIVKVVIGLAATIISALIPVAQILIEVIYAVLQVFGQLIQIILAVINEILSRLAPVFTLLGVIIQLVWLVLSKLVSLIIVGVLTAFKALITIIGKLINILNTLWTWFKDNIIPILKKLASIIKTVVVTAIKLVIKVIQAWINILKTLWGWFKDNILPILKTLANIIKTVVVTAIQIVINIIQSWIGVLKSLWGWFKDNIIPIIERLAGILKGVLKGAIDIIISAFKTLIKIVEKVVNKFRNLVNFLKNTVIKTFETVSNAIHTYIIDPLQAVIDKIKDVIDWFGRLGKKSDETAAEASANADKAKGSESSASLSEAYVSNINATAGRAYSGISNGMPTSTGSTNYNSNKYGFTFNVQGGYRKSLHELQRDAQVSARKKGVVLR